MSNRPETNKQSCPVYKKCGGCQLQNLSYPEQLEFKQRKVEKLLKRFCTVEKIIGMKTPYHYRNKVQAAFGVNRQGQIRRLFIRTKRAKSFRVCISRAVIMLSELTAVRQRMLLPTKSSLQYASSSPLSE